MIPPSLAPPLLLCVLGDARFAQRAVGGRGAVSTDGRYAVLSSGGRPCEVDLDTAAVRFAPEPPPQYFADVRLTADGAVVACAAHGRGLFVYDRATLTRRPDLDRALPSALAALAPCPVDGARLAVLSAPASLLVALDGDAPPVALAWPAGTYHEPVDLAWSRDGETLWSIGARNVLRFDGRTGAFVALAWALPSACARVVPVDDGAALLAVDYAGRLLRHELATGETRALRDAPERVTDLATTPSGDRVAVITATGFCVLDARALTCSALLPHGIAPSTARFARPGIALTPDGRRGVLFDPRGALTRISLDPPSIDVRPPVGGACGLVFEPDGAHVQVLRFESPVERIALADNAITRFAYVDSHVPTLSATRDRAFVDVERVETVIDLVARASRPLDRAAEPMAPPSWSDRGFVVDGATVPVKGVHGLVRSRDGQRVYVLIRGAVMVFALSPPTLVARWSLPGLTALVEASGGELVVASSRGSLAWIDAETGAVRAKSGRIGEPRALAVSDDGAVAAASSGVSTVHLVRRADPRVVLTFEGGEHVTALAFDATGERLATAGDDALTRIFDVGAPALMTFVPPDRPTRRRASR